MNGKYAELRCAVNKKEKPKEELAFVFTAV
jgi:hypothetical protein